jgi:CDP-glucose 4,6-dehydratase
VNDRTTHRWEPDRSFWADRAVGVTGATGFLGACVTEVLVRLGAQVVVLVRDQVPPSPAAAAWIDEVAVVNGPVEDQALVERMLGDYEVCTLIHLAAQSQVGVANRNPVATFDANVRGTWTTLEAARRSPKIEQVIVASSDKAYGTQPTLPYDEDMPLLANNPYDVSKACADLIAGTYHHAFGLPVTVTRCGNFFGPGDHNWERLVPGTIRSLLRGERPVIRSDGTMVRDYLYVVDGALAYLGLAEAMGHDPSLAGQTFNFSTETPLTVLDLVALLQKAAGTDLEPDVRATATNEIDRQFLSAAKARRVLGWRPRYSIDDALRKTIDWYREHLSAE